MKNILITGGAGFIGSNLALKLHSLGYSVTVLDNLSPQIHGENPENSGLYQSILGKVTFIKGSITSRNEVEKAILNQDAIIHLAAETGTGQSMYEIEKYNLVNVYGTSLLLDVLVNTKNSVKKFILASSRAVYGEGKYTNSNAEILYPEARKMELMQEGIFQMIDEQGDILTALKTDENSKLHPISYYGITKLQQEQTVAHICKSIGIDYIVLRYQNVYGAGQSLRNPYTGILSIFSTQILSGENLNIFEDGEPARDFVNIQDAVDATIAALELETVKNEILNVGSGTATTVLEIAKILVEKYNQNTQIDISGNFRIGDIRYNVADLSKIKSLLSFGPKVDFSQGITQFTDWVLTQPVENNNFSKSLVEMQEKGFLKS